MVGKDNAVFCRKATIIRSTALTASGGRIQIMAAGIVAALLTATLTQMISCGSYEISQLLDLHYRPPLLRDRAHGCSSNTLPFVKKTSHVLAPFCFPSPVWRGVLGKL